MKKTITMMMGAAILASAHNARAGDQEWAVAGKILTGVIGAGLLIDALDGGSCRTVYYETDYVRRPPVAVRPKVVIERPRVVVRRPAPAVVVKPPRRVVVKAPPRVVVRGSSAPVIVRGDRIILDDGRVIHTGGRPVRIVRKAPVTVGY